MKAIVVKKINEVVAVSHISSLLDKNSIESNPIAVANWKEFPYRPEVCFRIAHDGKNILLNYRVKENSIRARYTTTNSMVWTDSCVEFFILPSGQSEYYNIECNCIGVLCFGMGNDGLYRTPVTADVCNTIQRWSSLGTTPFEEIIGEVHWELSLIIPAGFLFKTDMKELSGQTMRGNVYKCGDELINPHFLSWCSIHTPTPNFHQPNFFGTFLFE